MAVDTDGDGGERCCERNRRSDRALRCGTERAEETVSDAEHAGSDEEPGERARGDTGHERDSEFGSESARSASVRVPIRVRRDWQRKNSRSVGSSRSDVRVDADFLVGDGVDGVPAHGVVVVALFGPAEGREHGFAEAGFGVDPGGVVLDGGDDAELFALDVDEELSFVLRRECRHTGSSHSTVKGLMGGSDGGNAECTV